MIHWCWYSSDYNGQSYQDTHLDLDKIEIEPIVCLQAIGVKISPMNLTFTGLLVRLEFISIEAAASIRAYGVPTNVITFTCHFSTFINICSIVHEIKLIFDVQAN